MWCKTFTLYANNYVLWPTLVAINAVFPFWFPVNEDAKLEELSTFTYYGLNNFMSQGYNFWHAKGLPKVMIRRALGT
jgi:hypothetical protein